MRSGPASTAWISWLPPIAWAGVLFALSSGSGPAFAPPYPHIDKLEHAGAYAVLGFLVARAAARTWRLGAVGTVFAGGLAAAAYGVSDEYHQSFTPGRMVEVADAIADTVGGFAGAIAFSTLSRRLATKAAANG